jgi:WD40 repeat protein
VWAAVSPDGRRLLSSDLVGHDLRLWDIETRKQLHRINWGPVSPIRGSFTPDGRHAVRGGTHEIVRMYRLPATDKDKAGEPAALPGKTNDPQTGKNGT